MGPSVVIMVDPIYTEIRFLHEELAHFRFAELSVSILNFAEILYFPGRRLEIS